MKNRKFKVGGASYQCRSCAVLLRPRLPALGQPRRPRVAPRTTARAWYHQRALPPALFSAPQMAMGVGSVVVGGTAIPLIAAEMQFWKARGGN